MPWTKLSLPTSDMALCVVSNANPSESNTSICNLTKPFQLLNFQMISITGAFVLSGLLQALNQTFHLHERETTVSINEHRSRSSFYNKGLKQLGKRP